MPELPEVETIRRDLQSTILGQKIVDFKALHPKTIRNSQQVFKKTLVGNKIKKIHRRGKLLIFGLTKPRAYLLLHLKMTGQLIYQAKRKTVAGGHSQANFNLNQNLPSKHTRAIIDFQNGAKLFFNDLRIFGYLQIADQDEKTKILANNFGLEPFTKNFKLENFLKKINKKTIAIKAVLLDQKIIAGIGNIYADEICWRVRIKPQRRANTLSKMDLKKIFTSIEPIFKNAIKHRGTTFRNYTDSNGQKGNYTRLLKVYGRSDLACKRCKNIMIKKTRVAGRGTCYCPNCQK